MTASTCAVVLAGGESRRFGSDKLAAPVDGVELLDLVVAGLPADWSVVVVGPERALGRAVRFVREDPPGGGPTAAMVTGVQAALEGGALEILVLPGDAPLAGRAAQLLLDGLHGSESAAVVGTDGTGFMQPLQLALRRSAAVDLVTLAGPSGGYGARARALVDRLEPAALRWPLDSAGHFDIDTPQQLQAWTLRDGPAVGAIASAVDEVAAIRNAGPHQPVVVALDGWSGSGKSTLAAALALHRPVTVIASDDFYATTLAELDFFQRERLTDAVVSERVIDWRRLRAEALEPLSRGERARFARYDWEADDGRLGGTVTLEPSDLVVLEGVYSARPELADLVDVAVYVDVDEAERRRRLDLRTHDEPAIAGFWERGESYYFAQVRPPESFDLRVDPSAG